MRSSIVVIRSEAGSAELAVPAHGLSLTQRRFLTLLDTSCTLEELALRHPAAAEKLERDVSRLVDLGLVVCDHAANDATQPEDVAANDSLAGEPRSPHEEPAPQHIARIGSSRGRRIAWTLIPVAVLITAWAIWQSSSAPTLGDPLRARASQPAKNVGAGAQPADLDVTPIATRVLKGDPERPRDASKDARAATKTNDGRASSDAAKPARETEPRTTPPIASEKLSPVLPIEHRSPSVELAPMPSAAPTPGTVPVPEPTPASAPRPPASSQGGQHGVQVASLAPPAGVLHPAPASSVALVPIVRESPAFPREAVGAGLSRGDVKAQLAIDAKGNVTDVTIVEASHRAFNRAVRETLSRWRFEPGAPNRTTTVDIAFTRD
ncbi:MAG TPA: TonB family protein [Casimicrobiaceae bacterium]|nr:TonB family protein [Casimicrobiaceae bacterium]